MNLSSRTQVFNWRSFLLIFILSLSHSFTSYAERWVVNISEAEATEIIRDLLIKAELPPDKLKRGAYPLFGYAKPTVLPLLSTPCPLLLSCDDLTQKLKVALVSRGYQLVYSDQSPRPGGPIHFAIARGKRPVLALRLHPSHSSITGLLQVEESLIHHQSALRTLPQHLTLSLPSELLRTVPELVSRLVEQQREILIQLDEVMIKKSLLDLDSGVIHSESSKRRAQFGQQLDSFFKMLPNAVGVYLNPEAIRALDRALSDELVEKCAQQHRIIVTVQGHDTLLQSIARAEGVRYLELQKSVGKKNIKKTELTQQLKSLEANLVLTGEISININLASAEYLMVLSDWIQRLEQRQVNVLRISERAW